MAREFFKLIVEQARQARLMSSEHFTVDGTLIDAWASLKSFSPKDEARKARNQRKAKRRNDHDGKGGGSSGGSNPTVDFHGERRSNETHQSTTDPEARLYRKGSGQPAKLCYGAHALMENRNGLLVDLRVEEANGYGERDTALAMLADAVRPSGGATVGADKAYDSKVFVEVSRSLGVTPHVARNTSRRSSAIDARTTRHAGYAVSQRVRKRVEEIFGWMKTVGNFRRTRFIGRKRTELAAHVVAAAYNLVRMTRLLPTLA